MKQVTILGSTGTIGVNTLDIIAAHPERFSVSILTAQENVTLLAQQALKFKPDHVVIGNKAHYAELKKLLNHSGIEINAGEEALADAASLPCDVVMSAIVGSAGLKPTLAAIRTGARIALANKECLVCAGELMNAEIKKYGAIVIPVDSEHSGVFQLIAGTDARHIAAITLTASGGPFRNHTLAQLKEVTPAQAVKHPNWNMGAKISVDSATLMNKGIELIEAHYLFGTPAAQLDAIIHPQSIIHALVEMIDGSVLAQMSEPDMRAPIAYALAYPNRITTPVKKLNLAALKSLDFETPDETRFPCLTLAKQALIAGGSAPTVLNAANEIAVARFLKEEISFMDIPAIVEKSLAQATNLMPHTLDELFTLDADTRRFAEVA